MAKVLQIQIDPSRFNYFYRTKKKVEEFKGASVEMEEIDNQVNLNCFLTGKASIKKFKSHVDKLMKADKDLALACDLEWT